MKFIMSVIIDMYFEITSTVLGMAGVSCLCTVL